MRRCIIILTLCVINIYCFNTIADASLLLNLNCEERAAYDAILGSQGSDDIITSLFPLSLSYGRLASNPDTVWYSVLNPGSSYDLELKPLASVKSSLYYAREKGSYREGTSGTAYDRGINSLFFQDGYLGWGTRAVMYWSFRERFTQERNEFNLYRMYGKVRFGKFSVEGGVDNVNLGPGEYGLLLSDNTKPFPLLKFQTEEELEWLGKWKFLLMNGWLIDDREDHDNPKIMAVRIVWKPWWWLELGGTRTTMYGGEGRPEYKIWEYPRLFWGGN